MGLEVAAHPPRRDPLRQQHRTPRQPSLHPHNLGAIRLWARIVSDSETDRAQITKCAGLPSRGARTIRRRVEGGGDVPAVGAGDGLDGGGDVGHQAVEVVQLAHANELADAEQVSDRIDSRGLVGRRAAARSAPATTRSTSLSSGSTSRLARSVRATHPRAVASADGSPAGQGTSAPPVVGQPDRHRRAVGDRHDDGRRCGKVDPLDRHGGRWPVGEHVAPCEGTGDRQRRVVGDLDERAPAIVGDRPDAVDGVAARDPQPRLGDRRAEQLTLAHGDLALGVCQRSSAATCQSSTAEPSHGTTAPHSVTSARQGWPSAPVITLLVWSAWRPASSSRSSASRRPRAGSARCSTPVSAPSSPAGSPTV